MDSRLFLTVYVIVQLIFRGHSQNESQVGKIIMILNRVTNPEGKLEDGSYCDSPQPDTNLKCDMVLKICWGAEDSAESVESCKPAEIEERELPHDTDDVRLIPASERNVIMKIFNNVPARVMMKIRITDKDTDGNDPVIDNIAQVVQLTKQDKRVTLIGKRASKPVTVEVLLRYSCTESYYGTDCSRTCLASASCDMGFYECGPEGEKQCSYGFTGATCTDLAVNNCPNYKGIGISSWSGTYVCDSKNYDVSLRFDSVETNNLVSGEGQIKLSGAQQTPADVFAFSGSQDMSSGALTLNVPSYKNQNPTFTDVPNLALVARSGLTGKMTIGSQCPEAPLSSLVRRNETVPECMYQHTKCYRYGDNYNEYGCCCRNGFYGIRCETPPNLCSPNNCQNEAACANIPPLFEDYRCDCKPGTYGQRCEILANNVDCQNVNPCQNNAMCVNLTGDFHCRCKAGFYGKECDKSIENTVCRDGLCVNTGQCTNVTAPDGTTSFSCTCANGFTGVMCELEVPQQPKSLQFESVTSREATLKWLNPDNYAGAIDIYQIKCRMNESHSTIVLSGAPDTYVNISWPATTTTLTDLHPASQYQCSVRAAVGNKYGPFSESVSIETKVEAPELTRVPYVYYQRNTDTTIFLFVPETFSRTGPITKYSFVVHLVSAGHSLKKRSIDMVNLYLSRVRRATLTEMNQNMKSNLTDYDNAKTLGLTYYIAAEYPGYKTNFTIGDNETYGGYLNKPLTPGLQYKVYYGITTEDNGVVDTRYVDIGPTVKAEYVTYPNMMNQTGLAVGITMLCLAFVTGILLVLICWLTRGSMKDDKILPEKSSGEVQGLDNPAHVKRLAEPACPGTGTPVPAQQSNLYHNLSPSEGSYGTINSNKPDNDYSQFESTYGGHGGRPAPTAPY